MKNIYFQFDRQYKSGETITQTAYYEIDAEIKTFPQLRKHFEKGFLIDGKGVFRMTNFVQLKKSEL